MKKYLLIKYSLISTLIFPSAAVLAESPTFAEPPPPAEQVCQRENIRSSAPSSRFIQMPDGPVVDKATGLMWRMCQEGASGDACKEGKPLTVHWADALLYPVKVNADGGIDGYRDWRLPNIRELGTLVEIQCAHPAVNSEVFPNAHAIHVWTSSPYNFYTDYSWYVNFANGAPTYDLRSSSKGLWLVREMDRP